MLTIISFIAQRKVDLNQNISGIGPLGFQFTSAAGCNSIVLLADVISKIVGVLTVLGFIRFMYEIVTGGIRWIMAEGDKAKVQLAHDKILHGVIGLVITVSAIFIVGLVAALLGIADFLYLPAIIKNLLPMGIQNPCNP